MTRGKKGAPPKEVRPTSGKVLGALFSILGPLQGRSFLDLFSGTGRVAYRAAQKGASCVAAVEILPVRARDIRSLFPAAPSFLLLAMDIRRALSFLERKGHRFEVIFADPPYNKNLVNDTIVLIGQYDLLAPGGLILMEYSRNEGITENTLYEVIREKSYGNDTRIAFIRHRREGV